MKRFQKQIVTNQLTLPMAVILCIACWAICYMMSPVASLRETIVSFILYAIIGYLLIALNKTYAIIRLRASFQTIVFLLLAAIFPDIHQLYAGNLMSLCWMGGLFLFFSCYQHNNPTGLIFHAFILWGIGSLLVPKFVWIFPFIWYASLTFRAFTLKSFIASLFGWSIPVAAYAVYLFLNGQEAAMLEKAEEVIQIDLPLSLEHPTSIIVSFLFLVIIFIVSSVHSLSDSLAEKVQTRSYLQHLIIISLALFVLMVLSPSDIPQLKPLLLMTLSLLYGHFAAITNSKWSNIFFIFVLLGMIPIFLLNLAVI
ncbi:MAG: hypothetical protein IJ628_09805 [Bacteroidaceae bacterium]|nr:hypothetical protein [Bacteroidaceae bacterium]